MSESLPYSPDNKERHSRTFKRSMGRLAVRATAVLAGASAVFTGIASTEAVTSNEAAASASQGYHITGAEKAWCRWPSRWNLCNQAQSMAAAAKYEAEKVSNDRGWSIGDGGADAVRHCVWNGLMAANLDASTAQGFADRHEYDDTQEPGELDMDLHNNKKGREWATADLGQMVSRCVVGVEKDELVRLNT